MNEIYVARFRKVFVSVMSIGAFVIVLVVAQLAQTSDPSAYSNPSPRLIGTQEYKQTTIMKNIALVLERRTAVNQSLNNKFKKTYELHL